MRALVIGSGLIGVSTAWALARAGAAVTVVDRATGPGLETSFANGSLLTPSMADPWNTPGCWRVLLRSLGRTDSPLQLRAHALPGLVGWGARFLWNSRRAAFHRAMAANFELAHASLAHMETIREETGIDYARGTKGTLRIFRSAATLDEARHAANILAERNFAHDVLSPTEISICEPGLAPIAQELAGGIHYPADETGDAQRFCTELAGDARKRGVDFRFGAIIDALESRRDRVVAAICGEERIEADLFVIAAGSFSPLLLRKVGVTLPVRPAKGYSVTVPLPPGETILATPVVDDTLHAAIVPLPGRIRVAGTAEFTGYDRSIDPERVANLLGLLKAVLPQASFDLGQAQPWCGLRAMSADGVPVIGRAGRSNLFVNTGQGHLGWTMAAASGRLLADLAFDRSPIVDPRPYSFNRF